MLAQRYSEEWLIRATSILFWWLLSTRLNVVSFSTGHLGFKLRQEQEKGISRGRNTSQRAFFPTESPGQDIPSRNSQR
jgi:hypothetical protein